MYDGWLEDLADQGYTDEQIQGIRQWARAQEEDRLLAYAEALEEAGWTVEPPAHIDGRGVSE